MTARNALELALAFLALVACNLAGGAISSAFHLPVPGTVIGILLLLMVLRLYGHVPDALQDMAVFLLGHLNFFYIPAGVGIMAYAALIRQDLLPIVVALIGGTFIALVAGALAFNWMLRLTGHERDSEERL